MSGILRLGIMSCCMLSQIITLINERLVENSKGSSCPSFSLLTLAVLAACAPTVETVAWV